jgi:hypothetical protein
MKIVKEVAVHPYIGNDKRQEVINWCNTQFGEYHETAEGEQWRWYPTSNYTRSKEGTFDVIFRKIEDAEWFLLRWGGDVVYTDVEGSEVDAEVFKNLFEV